MEDNNKFAEWFNDNFDVVVDGKIHKDQFQGYLAGSKYKDMELKDIKDNLTRMKIQYK